ncbi:venom metalloproteinase antarease-like TtrivMP_A, partial [Ixodes scapularis]
LANPGLVCVKGWNVELSAEAPPLYHRFSTIAHEIGHLLHKETCWKTQSDYDFSTVTKEVAGPRLTPEILCRRINPDQYFSAVSITPLPLCIPFLSLKSAPVPLVNARSMLKVCPNRSVLFSHSICCRWR